MTIMNKIDTLDEASEWIDDGRTYSTDEEINEEEQYINDDLDAEEPLQF